VVVSPETVAPDSSSGAPSPAARAQPRRLDCLPYLLAEPLAEVGRQRRLRNLRGVSGDFRDPLLDDDHTLLLRLPPDERADARDARAEHEDHEQRDEPEPAPAPARRRRGERRSLLHARERRLVRGRLLEGCGLLVAGRLLINRRLLIDGRRLTRADGLGARAAPHGRSARSLRRLRLRPAVVAE
jgi:hypothetical protein